MQGRPTAAPDAQAGAAGHAGATTSGRDTSSTDQRAAADDAEALFGAVDSPRRQGRAAKQQRRKAHAEEAPGMDAVGAADAAAADAGPDADADAAEKRPDSEGQQERDDAEAGSDHDPDRAAVVPSSRRRGGGRGRKAPAAAVAATEGAAAEGGEAAGARSADAGDGEAAAAAAEHPGGSSSERHAATAADADEGEAAASAPPACGRNTRMRAQGGKRRPTAAVAAAAANGEGGTNRGAMSRVPTGKRSTAGPGSRSARAKAAVAAKAAAAAAAAAAATATAVLTGAGPMDVDADAPRAPAALRIDAASARLHTSYSADPTSPAGGAHSPLGGSPRAHRRKGKPSRARLDSEDVHLRSANGYAHKDTVEPVVPDVAMGWKAGWKAGWKKVKSAGNGNGAQEEGEGDGEGEAADGAGTAGRGRGGYGLRPNRQLRLVRSLNEDSGDEDGQQQYGQEQYAGTAARDKGTAAALGALAVHAAELEVNCRRRDDGDELLLDEGDDVQQAAAVLVLGARGLSGSFSGRRSSYDEGPASPRRGSVGLQQGSGGGSSFKRRAGVNNSSSWPARPLRPPRPPGERVAYSAQLTPHEQHHAQQQQQQPPRGLSLVNSRRAIGSGAADAHDMQQRTAAAHGSNAHMLPLNGRALGSGTQLGSPLARRSGSGGGGSIASDGTRQRTMSALLDAVGHLQLGSSRPELQWPQLPFAPWETRPQPPSKVPGASAAPAMPSHANCPLLANLPSLEVVQRMAEMNAMQRGQSLALGMSGELAGFGSNGFNLSLFK